MCCERCKLYNSLNVFSEELKICHVKRLHDGKKKQNMNMPYTNEKWQVRLIVMFLYCGYDITSDQFGMNFIYMVFQVCVSINPET